MILQNDFNSLPAVARRPVTGTFEADRLLKTRLESYAERNPDYWSFRGNSKRERGHDWFQYPGMMVPQMLGPLLDEILRVHPNTRKVFDPFVGSGTTLTESMARGLDFTGGDINPLAILLCKAKAQQDSHLIISRDAVKLLRDIETDTSSKIDVKFDGMIKWFSPLVRVELSRIRRAIRHQPLLASRRFFWVALAETVRLTSHSRTSTYKLHIRSEADRKNRKSLSAVTVFGEVLLRNLLSLEHQQRTLKAYAHKGRYDGAVRLRLENIMTPSSSSIVAHDLLLTSPPYGDNKTTVPYGQNSYLPLQWIDFEDIDIEADPSYLSSTAEIDSRSLGGTLKGVQTRQAALQERSDSFAAVMRALEHQPADRAKRVAGFCLDFDHSLSHILDRLKPNALMVWTVGNRRVGGVQVPIDTILLELLAHHSVRPIVTLSRTISSKRMAQKNQITDTMAQEKILVLRTAAK